MGNEVFLYFKWVGVDMTARIPPEINPKIGERPGFAFKTEKIHLFDGESGKALTS